MTLGGFLCLKNANKLDFCWRESVRSLLPVCDSVALSVAAGEDDTEQQVRDWASREPKLSLNIYPLGNPVGDEWWYNKWLQYARMHTPATYVLQLDADEVLHEDSYAEIELFRKRIDRFSVVMHRLNFWRDAQHLIPDGFCCSHRVIRMAPQELYLASDGYDPLGLEVPRIAIESKFCKIFHYGFIRKKAAFFEKERFLQKAYFNTYDERLVKAEAAGDNWMLHKGVTGWENDLQDFKGTHPAIMLPWLKERGYDAS